MEANEAKAPERYREKPPETRGGRTLHFTITTTLPPKVEGDPDRVIEIGGYLTAGEYADGRLCEIFARMDAPTKRIGAMLPMIDEWAKAFSMALQYGADVDVLCDKFIATRYWPDGPVRGVAGMQRCTSPTDLMCRWLRARYGKKKPTEGTDGTG